MMNEGKMIGTFF